jgi:heme/copper-type cytochrome/quinol oxidase subunit 2
LKSIRLRDDVDELEVRARIEPILSAAGFDPRYFAAIDRVTIQAYVEDEALVVLSGARVQSLLEASQVMHGLAAEVFVSNRAMFPASVREAVAVAVEDLR